MSSTLLQRGDGTQIRDDGLEKHCKEISQIVGFSSTNPVSREVWIMELQMSKNHIRVFALSVLCVLLLVVPCGASAADKLFAIYSARVMSQSYPWIAEEAGLFKKYDLEIPL